MAELMPSKTNGRMASPPIVPDLPEQRRAAVEAGLLHYQAIATERDELVREVSDLKSQLAALKEIIEVNQARFADMDSLTATARLQRDQAIADRAKYESLFIGIYAQMRAFAVPCAPLVKEADPAAPDGIDEGHQQ